MKRFLVWLCLAGVAAAPAGREAHSAEAVGAVSFPLELAILDPDGKDKLPPYIVMFEKGLDQDSKDVRGPLGRLEALRGASKLFPESNDNPGLPVVMRGLRFHRQQSTDGMAHYEIELLGEFNTIKVPVNPEEMQKFLAGEVATFSLKGEKNFGLYSYVSTMKMTMQLRGDELLIFKIEGDFNFREGLFTYTSKSKKLTPPASRDYLFRGKRSELPALPTI
jgi:hypothetical protein